MNRHHCFAESCARNIWRIAAFVANALVAEEQLFALPTNGEMSAGQATISTPSATSMQIEQQSHKAIINWNSFGIGKGEALTIRQPSAQATLLNRVLSNDPSSIFGTLTANGRVFLVNPNGVFFAKGARLNVGGLVASTLAINDNDFLAEHYAFSQQGAKGSVRNEGSLCGEFVALLGSDITNTGTIITTKSSVGLASGDGVLLNLDASGLVAIKVEQNTYNARLENSGIIETAAGTVLISASAANDLLGSVVNNSGVIRATTVTERNGNIVIEGGTLINTGTFAASSINAHLNNLLDAGIWNADGGTIQIKATGTIEQNATSRISADGQAGGDIHIEAGEALYLSGKISANGNVQQGGKIELTAPQTTIAGAEITAHGVAEGGTILVGGGWQGNDASLTNAVTTTVSASSSVSANALESGNGGTVVIWSDHATTFAGSIEAKGGAKSGNGGMVEVSGHEALRMSGRVVTTAPNGTNGSLLLDPRDITIDVSVTPQLFSIIPLPDPNPAAGDQHGSGAIVELQNGNILVASPLDDFAATNAGAVRLYKPDGTLLSTLVGSTANDQVGEIVVALRGNSNAVTLSRKWSNGGLGGIGAATWIDGTNGTSGNVSSANSLIGSTLNDAALSTITPLTKGNYVLASPAWDNGAIIDAGAVSWGDGATGTAGVISESNSLVGSSKSDGVSSKVTALTNGNYVVSSPNWDKGTTTNVGAVTWASGVGGGAGVISATNSLIGAKSGDNVGLVVTALTNGNYVIGSPNWDNGSITNAGAATWLNGATGAVGTLNTANSLVGGKANDKVGFSITALSNGNYVVNSPSWDNGATVDVGAITWGNGVTGSVGVVSAANSLIGSTTGDGLGSTVIALTNGNYVVGSPNWDRGSVVNAGAITWGDGTSCTVGTISDANSLVGSTANDGLSYTIIALINGNYVVGSPHWDNGIAIDVGAVTWGNGAGGTIGAISAANSLIGSTTNDGDIYNITALTNGNYVVGSPHWDNGTAIDAGAVTWGNGAGGTVGMISAANSIVGSTKNDLVGSDNSASNRITALTNGNYVISSPLWDKGASSNAGAVTWAKGAGGTVGTISSTNSLVGSKTGDQVGSVTVALPNGTYVTASSVADNGSLTNAGAVTWGNGDGSLVGEISSLNSLLGSSKDDQLGSGGITPLTVGNMNGSFILSSTNWSNATGSVAILTPQQLEPVQQGYSSNPSRDNTLTPDQITALLNAGNDVTLKANNNLTVNSEIIADNPLGNGGYLHLHAGQSIIINADITTDNGNLTLIANETLAAGVVDSWRLAGNAVITMAAGTAIDAGTGSVTIELRNGEGRTNRESGAITLRTISARTISAINYGEKAGYGITLASGTLEASATEGNSIILAGENFENSARATLSTAGTARWLIYAAEPDAVTKGGLTSEFRHYSATITALPPHNVSESGNGFIYASAAGQLAVNTTLVSGKASSYAGAQPLATYGYTLSGFADNEESAEMIGLHGTMATTGAPTAASSAGTYHITYADGLLSSSGFTFTAGSALTYTVKKPTTSSSTTTTSKSAASSTTAKISTPTSAATETEPPVPATTGTKQPEISTPLVVTKPVITSTPVLMTTSATTSTKTSTTTASVKTPTKASPSTVTMTSTSASQSNAPSAFMATTSKTTTSNKLSPKKLNNSGIYQQNSADLNAPSLNRSINERSLELLTNANGTTYGNSDSIIRHAKKADMKQDNNVQQSVKKSEATSAQAKNARNGSSVTTENTTTISKPTEQLFTLPLPPELFPQNNPEAPVSLEIRSVNGGTTPSWISCDAAQKRISGTPPKEAVGEYRVEVIAKDQFGGERHTTLLINVE